MTMSAIHERLKKLHALALQGVGGEREQAQALFDKLSQKYGVQMEDLEEDKLDTYEFHYGSKEEGLLLNQIAFKVTNRTDIFYCYKDKRLNRNKQWIECTEAQKVEIEFLFEFYSALWERELKIFLQCFFQKHRLFGDTENVTNPVQLSDKDLEKMFSMMMGMDDASPLHQIEAGKKGE